MSNTKKILKEMNTGMFGFRQPSILHDIYVTGIREPDPNDNTKRIIVFVQTSKPNEKAKKAGINESTFIHASFKPVGTIKTTDESGREFTFSGPEKSHTEFISQSTRSDLFNFLKQAIEKGEDIGYTKNGEVKVTYTATDKTYKRPQFKLKRKLFGKIISLNVPPFIPHVMDEDGEFKPFTPITLDPLTGKYERKPLIRSTIKFFADDDELDLLEELATKIFDKRVRPWVTDIEILESNGK
jgi:hypothetical protein